MERLDGETVSDISEDIKATVKGAISRGGRPSGWTVKAVTFLWEEAAGDQGRWFSPKEIHQVMVHQYGDEVSREAVDEILKDAVRTSQLGASGGLYRVLR